MNYDHETALLWDRSEPRFPGDVRARPKALELLEVQPGETILDAGCGTGYMTRQIARLGARAIGCDQSSEMIRIAETGIGHYEDQGRLGIEYWHTDITDLGSHFADVAFDKILCCAVLIHNGPAKVDLFMRKACRVLKPGGSLIISVTHPFCYTQFSPHRTGQLPWQQFSLNWPNTGIDSTYTDSEPFREIYMDRNGITSQYKVWHHPIQFYLNKLCDAGFRINHVQEILWEREDIIIPAWEGPTGFPEWLQIKATKS